MELYISTALLEHSGFITLFFSKTRLANYPPFKEAALLNPNWRELEFWQHFVSLSFNRRAAVPHNTGRQPLATPKFAA